MLTPKPKLASRRSTGAILLPIPLLALSLAAGLARKTVVGASEQLLTVRGILKQHHKVVLDLAGPHASEENLGARNPFLNYRFDILFEFTEPAGSAGVSGHTGEEDNPQPRHSIRRVTVPGYFAADGNAAESSAESGSVWRCVFRPPTVGLWVATVAFTAGPSVAIAPMGRDATDDGSVSPGPGSTATPVEGVHGLSTTFLVLPTDKQYATPTVACNV